MGRVRAPAGWLCRRKGFSMGKRRSAQIKVTRADGSTEVVGPGHFQKSKSARSQYAAYRRSRHWRRVRKQRLRMDGFKCASCSRSKDQVVLEVHHRTYERIGRERTEDLISLCQRCHSTEHQWVAREAAARE